MTDLKKKLEVDIKDKRD